MMRFWVPPPNVTPPTYALVQESPSSQTAFCFIAGAMSTLLPQCTPVRQSLFPHFFTPRQRARVAGCFFFFYPPPAAEDFPYCQFRLCLEFSTLVEVRNSLRGPEAPPLISSRRSPLLIDIFPSSLPFHSYMPEHLEMSNSLFFTILRPPPWFARF